MREAILSALKFVLFILMIPVLVGVSLSVYEQIQTLPGALVGLLTCGVGTYAMIHLFIFQPRALFDFGQKLVGDIFQFFAPLAQVAQSILPFYTILLMISLYVTSSLLKITSAENYFIFFIGFTFAMHMILTAQVLDEGEEDTLRAHYFLCMGCIYIINVFLVTTVFSLLFPQFSFHEFFKGVVTTTNHIYTTVYKQLFAV